MTFEQWLAAAGYRPTTVRQTVQQMEMVIAGVRLGGGPDPYQAPAVRRWMRWAEINGGFEEELQHLRAMGFEAIEPETKVAPERKVQRRSFQDAQWVELVRAILTDGTRESQVLALMVFTGMRIGDALAIPYTAIQTGLESGAVQIQRKGGRFVDVSTAGSEEQWADLEYGMRATRFEDDIVASYVQQQRNASPLAGDAPYRRVDRALKRIGRDIGLRGGPVHLQRIRRTIAVQALRETEDVRKVQGLLCHASIHSTLRYVDEPRVDEVGQLQQRLGRFREGVTHDDGEEV